MELLSGLGLALIALRLARALLVPALGLAALCALWVLGGCELPEAGSGDEDGPRARAAPVVRVLDGDTVEVERAGRELTVRMIGLDSPESVRPGYRVECGGPEASRSLEKLVAEGARVRLIVDRSQDRIDAYGRRLRYVEYQGHDLGRAQVRRGWAEPYVYEEPFARQPSYERAARAARARERGVWGSCDGDFHSAG